MEIRFSQQAEDMIKQMAKPDEIKAKLINLARIRAITITGGDVLKFIIKKQIGKRLDGEEI